MPDPETFDAAADDGALRRALFLVHSYPPSTNVAVQRTTRFIRYLPQHGWQADVLAPGTPGLPPHLVPGVGTVTRVPEWLPLKAAVALRDRLRSQFRASPASEAPRGGAVAAPDAEATDTARSPSLVVRYVEPWFATPDEHVGWYPRAVRAAARLARARQTRVLYTSGPPHSAHLVALRLRQRLGIPWVADFRDPWSRRPWLALEDRRGLRHAAQVRMEAMVVGAADRVVLNTEPMAEDFRRHYPNHAGRFVAITNGYDPEQQVDAGPAPAPSPDVLTIIHAGSLYRRRDPRPLLEALARVVADQQVPPGRLVLRLLGHIDPAFGVSRLVQSLGLQDVVRVEGRVSHADTLVALRTSHVLVLLQPGTHLQVPAKLFEYIQTGRWILALTPDGATADIVRGYGLGDVVPAEDVGAIAVTLTRLWQRHATGAALQVDTARALADFDGRRLTGLLARVFDEVTAR